VRPRVPPSAVAFFWCAEHGRSLGSSCSLGEQNALRQRGEAVPRRVAPAQEAGVTDGAEHALTTSPIRAQRAPHDKVSRPPAKAIQRRASTDLGRAGAATPSPTVLETKRLRAVKLRIEKLTRHHTVTGFDCANEPLNRFLQRFALANQQANASQTYLGLAEDVCSRILHAIRFICSC